MTARVLVREFKDSLIIRKSKIREIKVTRKFLNLQYDVICHTITLSTDQAICLSLTLNAWLLCKACTRYIFSFLLQIIDCGYLLELPRQGGSNEEQCDFD